MLLGLSTFLRCGLAASLVLSGTVMPLGARESSIAKKAEDSKAAAVSAWDENDQDSPIVELDPERAYKGEALLSFRSTLAPYGKVVGIRLSSEKNFTPVKTWKDIEDFVIGTGESRVTVKLLEPWGAEVIAAVNINRKSYPASVRPVEPPAAKSEPTKPAEQPKPTAEPAAKPAVAFPTKQGAKSGGDQSKPLASTPTKSEKPKPVSPAAPIQPGKQASAPAKISSPEPVAPKVIVIGEEPRLEPLETAPSASKPHRGNPAQGRVSGKPSPASPGAVAMEPTLSKQKLSKAALPRPVAEGPKAVPVKPAVSLATKSSPSKAESGEARPAKSPSYSASTSGANPALMEPKPLRAVPIKTAAARPIVAKANLPEWVNPYNLTLIAFSAFAPQPAPFEEQAATEQVVKNIEQEKVYAMAVQPSVPAPFKSARKVARVAAPVDEDAWLRDAVDLADKLGMLSAKPLVTSDRRQRAFAIYTLYMALKDLRCEVDSNARKLNDAIERYTSGSKRTNSDLDEVAEFGRTYERALTGIQKWNADAMKQIVRGYAEELQSMDDTRSMLTFLESVQKPPKIAGDMRAFLGTDSGQK